MIMQGRMDALEVLVHGEGIVAQAMLHQWQDMQRNDNGEQLRPLVDYINEGPFLT